jgi:metal-responsive CopG/Arc/MetJ family transcriptional regulator
MKTTQMTIDEKLLEDVDRIIEEDGITRSAFVRTIMRAEVKKRRVREMEHKHAEAYRKQPQQPDEYEVDASTRGWGDDW